MNSDPIADLLTRIRNGSRARLARIEVPHSKVKVSIAKLLKEEGFLEDVREIAGKTPGQGVIEIKLRYDDHRQPVLNGIKRVSKPGLRNYFRCQDIPKIQSGLGVMILTTSQGVLTDRQAKEKGVGGEALCAVW
jgi:small subunit ribosomal protein S8